MPCSSRAASESRWWVVVEGWVMRLFASPRLLEMRITLSALATRNAPFCPPFTSKVMTLEPPVICFRMMSACGWSGRPQ